MAADLAAEVTDLLQQLIRNECVNDGTAASGHEFRSADMLASYLAGSGLELQTFEPSPGRTSLVARIEGSDPAAPTLALMGHTDVVPVNPDGWQRDPFGGELVDGVVWGRGAVDMLNLTASMAVAVRRLARSGFTPRGSLVYLAVADEEALGAHGARWLTAHEAEAVAADYLITEGGGVRMPSPAGPRVLAAAAEKGTWWCVLRVRGTAGHASRPLRTDNALVKAAEVVRRVAAFRPRAQTGGVWRRYVDSMGFDPSTRDGLLDPERVYDVCADLPDLGLARLAHACTHTTLAPTVIHGGSKINVIPDTVEVEVDVRTLPGQTDDDVRAILTEALGDLAGEVEIVRRAADAANTSPVDTPLWAAMERATSRLSPGAAVVPAMMAGASDARFFRRLGATCYGFGLHSGRIPYSELTRMYHGNDERVDVESLRLTTELWDVLVRDFLG